MNTPATVRSPLMSTIPLRKDGYERHRQGQENNGITIYWRVKYKILSFHLVFSVGHVGDVIFPILQIRKPRPMSLCNLLKAKRAGSSKTLFWTQIYLIPKQMLFPLCVPQTYRIFNLQQFIRHAAWEVRIKKYLWILKGDIDTSVINTNEIKIIRVWRLVSIN